MRAVPFPEFIGDLEHEFAQPFSQQSVAIHRVFQFRQKHFLTDLSCLEMEKNVDPLFVYWLENKVNEKLKGTIMCERHFVVTLWSLNSIRQKARMLKPLEKPYWYGRWYM